ncbi:MAG: cyclophilin-like family protein [Pseudomonadota bacterium]
MPTNLVRSRQTQSGRDLSSAVGRTRTSGAAGGHVIKLQVGKVILRVKLHDTRTAERLWMMLPLFSTSEPWGDVVHFRIPVEIGRDRSARVNARLGEVYLWAEEDRIILPFGPTPLSRGSEIRLPWPCNVLGDSLDDVDRLKTVKVGEKVSLTRGDAS